MDKKINKKSQKKSFSLEKIFAISGILLVAFTAIATLFTLATSQVFIRDALDVAYYARFATTIIGGFTIGLLLAYFGQKRKNRTANGIVLTGLYYGLITFSLYLLADYVRIPLSNLFPAPGYPWGKIIFQGLPLAVLILTALLAAINLLRNHVQPWTDKVFQWLFIGLFVIPQISLVFSFGFTSPNDIPVGTALIMGALGILTTPLAVAVLAYIALHPISNHLNRLFLSSVIGTLFGTVMYISWEFRLSPEYSSTILFGIISTVLSYVAASLLLFFARRSVKS